MSPLLWLAVQSLALSQPLVVAHRGLSPGLPENTLPAFRHAVGLGVYAIEWAATPYRDDVLGALGGVFHGTMMEVRSGTQFMVADAYWVPPQGEPIGPMVLEITCKPDPAGCKLHVRQDGYEPSPRWRRYYAVVARGWQVSLIALKRYVEDSR